MYIMLMLKEMLLTLDRNILNGIIQIRKLEKGKSKDTRDYLWINGYRIKSPCSGVIG